MGCAVSVEVRPASKPAEGLRSALPVITAGSAVQPPGSGSVQGSAVGAASEGGSGIRGSGGAGGRSGGGSVGSGGGSIGGGDAREAGNSAADPSVPSSASAGEAARLVKFRLRDLQAATGNFGAASELGEGSFGKVFRATVDVGGHARDVAVKRLNEDSVQGVDEWLQEIQLLYRLKHPYLITLLGYCREGKEFMLVYEFCPNASVQAQLFKRSAVLPWSHRVRLAAQSAEALAFLHSKNVVHRDFKPANILLDQDMGVRLSDFGMCRQQAEGQTHVATRVMGTMGYLDPDYMRTGLLRQSADVYSFGIFLLELITGKNAMSDSGQLLTSWITPILEQTKPDLELLVDPNLEGAFDKASAFKIAVIARFCIGDAKVRPEMSMVAEKLRSLVPTTSRKCHWIGWFIYTWQ
ncbi:hypothetical protein CLOM_g23188 [Closterium sp. NIES-68]|nr:hypothetical protein CLOM_g23188 [Closterium sp. NIES-68]GJP77027.1 hypothetical protein CLOP_g7461 [Closterium sp. NIES-67]